MKTQLELIQYFTKKLEKVISFHGVNSDYTIYAFFLLQGANMNLPQEEIYEWARKKSDELHNEMVEIIN